MGSERAIAHRMIQWKFSEAASSWRVLMHSLKRIFAGRTAIVNEEGDPCSVVAHEALRRRAAQLYRAPRRAAAHLRDGCARSASADSLFAQSPWERAASNLERTFTGPLARSLALVAIVVGGLTFMFGEMGAKRQLAGIVFGGGLALFAAQFLVWLF